MNPKKNNFYTLNFQQHNLTEQEVNRIQKKHPNAFIEYADKVRVPDEFAKELIEVGKGIQDGSQLFSPEVNAKIAELFGKAANAPLGMARQYTREIYKIAGLSD